ncbi:hypothetical protein I7X12_12595 [Halosimplex litoreum]|uniref:Uncharacterized protein n=1 Tax=Halosimplex litoreum TaxID=1198301 RepID=A0A7T3FWK4_9EURY|nr:hypothetical protein [Halosimplex litoreum]QPV61598.1 hypothetical protein I7X12_12595 [Halosimplex litoreum]
MSLKISIEEIIPETVYQETVYEQVVIGKTIDGTRFGMFDYDMHVPPNSIGETLEICINLFIPRERVTTTDRQVKGVQPNENNPDGWSDHEFYGELTSLEEISQSSYECEIDVGVGTVSIKSYKNLNQHLSVGDFVELEASRTDIAGLVRDN